MSSNRSVITGANGYIGQRLSVLLSENGVSTVGCVRSAPLLRSLPIDSIIIGDISLFTQWDQVLKNGDVVVHLAARAHILDESHHSSNAINGFKEVNRDATLRLAEAAVKANVKRFIYVSSIGVLGNSTTECSFSNDTLYDPREPYAVSKMEAEIGLKGIAESSEMEVVIVRPPLVYGPGAPGNFHRLLKLVGSGLPLPLGGMHAKKSMISLNNLCDLLMRTVTAPLPKLTQLVVSDGSDWSTSELVALIAKYMENSRRLFFVPVPMLIAIASLVGKKEEVRKLSVALLVDGSETARLLNWSPVQLPEDGIKEAVEYYLSHKNT